MQVSYVIQSSSSSLLAQCNNLVREYKELYCGSLVSELITTDDFRELLYIHKPYDNSDALPFLRVTTLDYCNQDFLLQEIELAARLNFVVPEVCFTYDYNDFSSVSSFIDFLPFLASLPVKAVISVPQPLWPLMASLSIPITIDSNSTEMKIKGRPGVEFDWFRLALSFSLNSASLKLSINYKLPSGLYLYLTDPAIASALAHTEYSWISEVRSFACNSNSQSPVDISRPLEVPLSIYCGQYMDLLDPDTTILYRIALEHTDKRSLEASLKLSLVYQRLVESSGLEVANLIISLVSNLQQDDIQRIANFEEFRQSILDLYRLGLGCPISHMLDTDSYMRENLDVYLNSLLTDRNPLDHIFDYGLSEGRAVKLHPHARLFYQLTTIPVSIYKSIVSIFTGEARPSTHRLVNSEEVEQELQNISLLAAKITTNVTRDVDDQILQAERSLSFDSAIQLSALRILSHHSSVFVRSILFSAAAKQNTPQLLGIINGFSYSADNALFCADLIVSGFSRQIYSVEQLISCVFQDFNLLCSRSTDFYSRIIQSAIPNPAVLADTLEALRNQGQYVISDHLNSATPAKLNHDALLAAASHDWKYLRKLATHASSHHNPLLQALSKLSPIHVQSQDLVSIDTHEQWLQLAAELELLQEHSEANTSYCNSLNHLASTPALLGAYRTSIKLGHPPHECINYIHQALNLEPLNPAIWLELALHSYQTGDYNASSKYLTHSLAYAPRSLSVFVHFFMFLSLSFQGDKSRALDSAMNVIETDEFFGIDQDEIIQNLKQTVLWFMGWRGNKMSPRHVADLKSFVTTPSGLNTAISYEPDLDKLNVLLAHQTGDAYLFLGLLIGYLAHNNLDHITIRIVAPKRLHSVVSLFMGQHPIELCEIPDISCFDIIETWMPSPHLIETGSMIIGHPEYLAYQVHRLASLRPDSPPFFDRLDANFLQRSMWCFDYGLHGSTDYSSQIPFRHPAPTILDPTPQVIDGNSVLISDHSNSFPALTKQFWQALIDRLVEYGLSVYVNFNTSEAGASFPYSNCEPIFPRYSDLYNGTYPFRGIIALRSGFCDIVTGLPTPLLVLFPVPTHRVIWAKQWSLKDIRSNALAEHTDYSGSFDPHVVFNEFVQLIGG